MLKAARVQLVEAELAGMTERRMPQIMCQRNRLDQILMYGLITC